MAVPVLVDEGAGGDEDARPLLQGALHLCIQVGRDSLQGPIAWTSVTLRETSSEVDKSLHRHLRGEKNTLLARLVDALTPPLR